MVKVIADEFLTDDRERKYYADRYSCCPPPLFIIFITLVEVSFSFIIFCVFFPHTQNPEPKVLLLVVVP
jgi:rhomboid-related protein 1/2/3